MFDLTINEAKSLFLDSRKIQDKAHRANISGLTLALGVIRKNARRSIRSGRSSSRPGKPPISHTGLLKDNIFYGVERSTVSGVVGPALLNGSTGAPQVLEEGGQIMLSNGKPMLRDGKPVYIEPRPYMGPAFNYALPVIDDQWRGAVR